MRSRIFAVLAGAVLSASACGGDGPRREPEDHPTERDLTARWRGVEVGAGKEAISLVGDSLGERTALLHFPVVVEAPTPEIRRRLQAALSLDSAADLSMAWYRQAARDSAAPMINASYNITYKRQHLLDVRYRVEALGGGGPARYGSRHQVLDLRTGTRVTAEQAFRPDALAELAARVHERIHAAPEADGAPEVYTDADDAPPRFSVDDLDRFAIDDRGVTFFQEFGFPYIFGDGPLDAFFTWKELKPYIRQDGPLAIFL